MRRLFSPRSSKSKTLASKHGDGRNAPPSTPVSSYHNRLRHFSLVMEYQKLLEATPSGMYIVPDLDNFRIWHGVIFVRTGIYRKGIFKFIVQFLDSFPETPPTIQFSSKVFHPLIDPENGTLDLTPFKKWQPNDHVVDILSYLKSVFRETELWRSDLKIFNIQAHSLWQNDPVAFQQRADACVRLSLDRVYINESKSSIHFSRPIPEHDRLLDRIRNQDPVI